VLGKTLDPIRDMQGLLLTPTTTIADAPQLDVLLLPGGHGQQRIMHDEEIISLIQRQAASERFVFSVCTGALLCGAAGLLRGRRATTHWALADRFRAKYPKVKWMPELMVTEDRGFYCGGGVHAALDLSLYLVEKFCGHDVAMQSAKAMLIETPRAWQSGFAIVPLKTEHSDDAISTAQEWLHQNFHQTFPLDAPARRVGMSSRNFVRRFKQATGDSPLIYLQKLRIATAKRLLESDHRTMQEISDAVGYQDVAFFRQLFQRHAGVSPSAYRRSFGLQAGPH